MLPDNSLSLITVCVLMAPQSTGQKIQRGYLYQARHLQVIL